MYKETKQRKNAKQSIDSSIKKHKRVVLNFVQRQEIIEKLKKGCSVDKLALDYNVARRTIYYINSVGGEKLEKFKQENSDSLERKSFKGSDKIEEEEIEEIEEIQQPSISIQKCIEHLDFVTQWVSNNSIPGKSDALLALYSVEQKIKEKQFSSHSKQSNITSFFQ